MLKENLYCEPQINIKQFIEIGVAKYIKKIPPLLVTRKMVQSC